MSQTLAPSIPNHLLALVSIVLLCLGLFYLDYETRQFSDLLKDGNLVALVFYVVPAYLAFAFFHHWFQRWNVRWSAALAFVVGVPMAIALTMLAFALRLW
jgi:hypothetical protein